MSNILWHIPLRFDYVVAHTVLTILRTNESGSDIAFDIFLAIFRENTGRVGHFHLGRVGWERNLPEARVMA